jgi:hypothetical protein
MQKNVSLARALNPAAVGIRLVIHGPKLIDSGKIVDVVGALPALGPLHVLAGGTMARVAALDKHLTFIDASKKMHTSDALINDSDNEVLVLANCGKTSETGHAFGRIVSSRVRRSVIHVERPGAIDGSIILWEGADASLSSCVQFVARHLSERLLLKLITRQKNGLSAEHAGEVVTRHVYGAKPGEPLLMQGMVVGTVVDTDVVVTARRGRIVNISGAVTKAHGLEKITDIDLDTAYIKTGHLRTGNKVSVRGSTQPARSLQRGSVAFINHSADQSLDSVDDTTICAITVGDDTTSITADILSRLGIPIIGIIDGDGDRLYAGSHEVVGSVILRLADASDDDVGLLLEQSGKLDGRDYTLAQVIEIVKNILLKKGVEFSSTIGAKNGLF